jgi:hypothetical protein
MDHKPLMMLVSTVEAAVSAALGINDMAGKAARAAVEPNGSKRKTTEERDFEIEREAAKVAVKKRRSD